MHGSAPDIYGKNIANPIAMIWSGALMLDFLTQGQGAGRAAHDAIVKAIEAVLARRAAHARPGRASPHRRRRPGASPTIVKGTLKCHLSIRRDDLLPGRNFIGRWCDAAATAAAST